MKSTVWYFVTVSETKVVPRLPTEYVYGDILPGLPPAIIHDLGMNMVLFRLLLMDLVCFGLLKISLKMLVYHLFYMKYQI